MMILKKTIRKRKSESTSATTVTTMLTRRIRAETRAILFLRNRQSSRRLATVELLQHRHQKERPNTVKASKILPARSSTNPSLAILRPWMKMGTQRVEKQFERRKHLPKLKVIKSAMS